MSEERDFYADAGGAGYELPEDIPESKEFTEFEYYKHPAGMYVGFVGKLNPKYKDGEGKGCPKETPGALLSHFMLPFWTKQFLGSTSQPVQDKIISEELVLPDRELHECYYNMYLTRDDKRLWSLKKTFLNWKIPGHPQYDIVVKGTTPGSKKINYKAFPAYYGLPVKFGLTFNPKSEKQSRYVDGEIMFLDMANRIPREKMQEFEKAVNIKLAKEREEREARGKDSGYKPETAPETDFDNMASSDSNDLDDFLDGK